MWIFAAEPTPAATVRRALRALLAEQQRVREANSNGTKIHAKKTTRAKKRGTEDLARELKRAEQALKHVPAEDPPELHWEEENKRFTS